ncbi:NAD(P)H-dependent oxidoreductase, partial [Patescibacteria group bacterium]|nr:NAD(P)H-dependent oxidoreductase [Patescibacteria group bacterium]
MDTIKILGISGSLRKGSYHTQLLKAAQSLAPQGVTVDIAGIGDLPLFNQDLEQDPPESVKELKRRIKESDAVLFVTPEYNYSVPGVLKNAIDWASRPYGDSAWSGKPAIIRFQSA